MWTRAYGGDGPASQTRVLAPLAFLTRRNGSRDHALSPCGRFRPEPAAGYRIEDGVTTPEWGAAAVAAAAAAAASDTQAAALDWLSRFTKA